MSSTNESQIGKSGNIGTFAVAQFTEISGQTGGEVIDWWPHKEGILVIRQRPGLTCEIAGFARPSGLRIRRFQSMACQGERCRGRVSVEAC